MIGKITSFFSHQKNKSIPLYFTEDKTESITIEINPEKTISQIYLENINQISVIQAKIFQKKSELEKDYGFTLYSPKDPFIHIKLNDTSIPFKKLIEKNMIINYSLFYTEIVNPYNTSIQRRLNNLKNNKIQEEKKNEKPFSDETYVLNFVSPYNKIIDGEIEKYSYSHNKFIKIFIYIDTNKIMYQESIKRNENNNNNERYKQFKYSHNLWNVIPLSKISCIKLNSFDEMIDTNYIDINQIKDRLIMIKTFNKENIILKTNNKYEKEIWYNHLKKIVEEVRFDKIFFQFSNEINDISKKIYLNKIKFIYKLIGIKGTIRYKNSRKFLFSFFKNKSIEKIVECCIEYKYYVNKKNNYKALEYIKNLGEILRINKIKKDKKKNKESEKSNLIYDLLDEETYVKMNNILQEKIINKRSTLIILEKNLFNNLLSNVENKFLIKEHKKIIHQNKLLFLNSLNKIPAAQFCKNIHFNSRKMNVLFKENIEIAIPPDESDLEEFL